MMNMSDIHKKVEKILQNNLYEANSPATLSRIKDQLDRVIHSYDIVMEPSCNTATITIDVDIWTDYIEEQKRVEKMKERGGKIDDILG